MSITRSNAAHARQLVPHLLAKAIAATLVVSATAAAQSSTDTLQQHLWQRAVQSTFVEGPAAAHEANAPARVPAASAADASDVTQWRNDEFNADWGLQAINADAAYARGLTGKGVRLGVFDSGSGLDHDEFAGKDNRSLHLADVLADGSLCSNTTVLSGPSACFSSEGDQVAIDYLLLDPAFTPAQLEFLHQNGLFEGPQFVTHGTHVAGTIAANRDGKGMHGVAFASNLSVARLFFGSVAMLTVDPASNLTGIAVAGIGPGPDVFNQLYAQLEAQGARALNHSWGFSHEAESLQEIDGIFGDPAYRDYLDGFAQGSRGTGLIQVWAAGNSGAYNASPEQAPLPDVHAGLPRAFDDVEPYWLAVVNVDQNLQLNNLSHRCGYAANWCLAAPGSNIVSTVYGPDSELQADLLIDAAGNAVLDVLDRVPSHDYAAMSGTSMAAPHVTGALGLLFERFPYLDSAQVRDVLLTTATDLGAPGVDEVYGWGLVNLAKAVDGYGQLRVDTNIVMDQKAGGTKVWEGDAWDDWRNDIGGPGKLGKSGLGWLRLSGDNSFNGAVVRAGVLELDGLNRLTDAVTVEGGQFRLNGILQETALHNLGGSSWISSKAQLLGADLAVLGGVVSFNGVQRGGSTQVGVEGALSGTGELGDTRVEGVIAPGNSIGTLTVNGNYEQTATASLLAELAPGSRSDLLHVTGTARLDGTLVALPEPGTYYLGEEFNFLHADAGVIGRFARTDFSAFSPFLQFSLVYASDGARLEVARGASLVSAAVTANQLQVAALADAAAIEQGLPKPLTQLFPAQLGAALEALGGELYAATPIALLESSRYLRDAALRRGAAQPLVDASDAGSAVWVQVLGGSSALHGGLNAARTDANSNGVLVGLEHDLAAWRVGALLGSGRSDIKQAQGRASKAKIDNRHAGIFAGRTWGGLGLGTGLTVSRHDVESTRSVSFAGFSDRLAARHDARTRQAFIELGYRLGDAGRALEPYLQVARVGVDVAGIHEHGGVAALQGRVKNTRSTLGTAGLRFAYGLKAAGQAQSGLQLRGGLGYRRVSGDRVQVAQLGWAETGRFSVTGAALDANSLAAELGLTALLSPRQRLELDYGGQHGSASRDQSLSARWSIQF